ncbi:hypothetical protein BBJ28_00026063 [Nothophytophthora sp. Chile5]|nr:hypothetical protein BBJ28_00026063 [Nothophytophthora sp. Chile5]
MEAWPAHTVYNYIAAIYASYLKTARVLAGWESANATKAVHHPYIARLDDGVSTFDVRAQRSFGKEMFKMFLSRRSTDSVVEALTYSLLLYYKNIYVHQKDHIVNKAMENALVRAIPTMDLNRLPGVFSRSEGSGTGYTNLMQHTRREHPSFDDEMLAATPAETGSAVHYVRHSAQNLFGWLELLIKCNLPLSFCESKLARRYDFDAQCPCTF